MFIAVTLKTIEHTLGTAKGSEVPPHSRQGAPRGCDRILFLLQREGPPVEMCKNEVWPSAPRDGADPTGPELVPRGRPYVCSTDHQLTGKRPMAPFLA